MFGPSFSDASPPLLKPTFRMAHTLYQIQDLTLARLVPDYRYPHLDALVVREVELGKDISISSDYNIYESFYTAPVQGLRLTRRLAKWFQFTFDPSSKNSATQWQMQAEESRLYMLRQPQAIFKELCSNPTARQWLQETFEYRADAFFLIGYRSVINAKLIWKGQNNAEYGTYETVGERIIAVCYRKVTFKLLKKSSGAFLGQENRWKIFCEDRGDDNEEDAILEADIVEGDEIDDEGDEIDDEGEEIDDEGEVSEVE